ncbi:MAG: FkbM family methyltransferase [Bacteroidota bacterium]
MPGNSIPRPARKVLRRLLPADTYRRYATRHEDESLRIWARLSEAVPTSRAILDIGAFQGEFALVARRSNRKAPVYAFEPAQEHAAHLANVSKEAGIVFVTEAIGAENGTAQFLRHQKGGQAGQLVAHHPRGEDVAAEMYEVQVTTLDTWTQREGVRPALVKIDVEMALPALLQGVSETFRKDQPVVICEVLNGEAGQALEAALPDGYAARYVNELGRLERRSPIQPYSWRSRNWLLYPERGGALDVPSILPSILA